jgi:hypothetical protein
MSTKTQRLALPEELPGRHYASAAFASADPLPAGRMIGTFRLKVTLSPLPAMRRRRFA